MSKRSKSRDAAESKVEHQLMVISVDDHLRDLHGRHDVRARHRCDELLDLRLELMARATVGPRDPLP